MGKEIRLDKFLADMGRGTRSQIREMAKKGRISINGQPVKKTDLKVDPERDAVAVDGQPVAYVTHEYYMLHKPAGVVTATEDNLHRTVMDLLETARKDLFPVGRLDIDTEGLLLITNDGELAHQLLSPKKHVDKVYFARVAGALPEDAAQRMAEGMTLRDGTPVLPAELAIDGTDGNETLVRLTIREGKFHQVKRMFEALGCRVTYLKRLSMGPLILDENLPPGEYRPLTAEELAALSDCRAGQMTV